MRLIKVASMTMEEFIGSSIPAYAILSHTWEEEEVTFKDMAGPNAAKMKGYKKIRMTCELAAKDNLAYAWVDTCCIDKSSSAELTEAINSMFQWYKRAAICYVYLSDLRSSGHLVAASLEKCRWFTRGWTLQELIAPPKIKFFDRYWRYRGQKHQGTRGSSRDYLIDKLADVTGIDVKILDHSAPLSSAAVASKMSWAAKRETTRIEDMAYCLLGLFDVKMPLLYGEEEKAFTRLQQEIIRSTFDLSIFAWAAPSISQLGQNISYSGVLAEAPAEFVDCRDITNETDWSLDTEFSVTNKGIRAEVSLAEVRADVGSHPVSNALQRACSIYVLDLRCFRSSPRKAQLGIFLRKIGADLFVRLNPDSLAMFLEGSRRWYRSPKRSIISIFTKLPQNEHRIDSSISANTAGDRIVLSRRVCVAEIRIPLNFRFYSTNPASHWDVQDGVFFGTVTPLVGWGSAVIRGIIRLGANTEQIELLVVCLNWATATEPLQVAMADVSSFSHGAYHILAAQLGEKLHFDSGQVRNSLRSFGIPFRETMDQKQPKIDIVRGNGHVIATVSGKRVYRPNLCDYHIWQVDVSFTSTTGQVIEGEDMG
jgi:hypothetical protein